MLKKILKTAIGILLLPLLASFSIAFYEQFGNIDIFLTRGQQYFLGGIGAYCLIQLFLFKPAFLYVLGHEAVHVLAAWLCLAKVTSFKISSQGGSVTTSKTNLFISLSPYFVPIYALLLIVVYYLINNVIFSGIFAPSYFMFLLGMALAFHIVMTVDTLKTRQPDLVKAGYLTSGIFIYVINITIVAWTLGLVFDGFSFRNFLNNAVHLSGIMYQSIFNQLFL